MKKGDKVFFPIAFHYGMFIKGEILWIDGSAAKVVSLQTGESYQRHSHKLRPYNFWNRFKNYFGYLK